MEKKSESVFVKDLIQMENEFVNGNSVDEIPKGLADYQPKTGHGIRPENHLLQAVKEDKTKSFGLSPISEISFSLVNTNIRTPMSVDNYLKSKLYKADRETKSARGRLFQDEDAEEIQGRKRKYFEISPKEGSSRGEIASSSRGGQTSASLISNNFTLNGNDEINCNNGKTKDENIYKYYNNGSQRRKLYDFSPQKTNNEFLLYDDEQTLMSPTKLCARQKLQYSPATDVDGLKSLDEFEGCSTDSGFGQLGQNNNNNNQNENLHKFKFAQPKLRSKNLFKNKELTPRNFSLNNNNIDTINNNFNYNNKNNNTDITMCKNGSDQQTKQLKLSPKEFKIFHSLSSGSIESIDDEWSDLIEMETFDDDQTYPSNLKSLISGHIKTIRTSPEQQKSIDELNHLAKLSRYSIRRSLSMNETNIRRSLFDNDSNNNTTNYITSPIPETNNIIPKTPEIINSVQNEINNCINTPNSSITIQRSYINEQTERCFKRPENFSPVQSKRFKTDLEIHQYQSYSLEYSQSSSCIGNKENHSSHNIIEEEDVTESTIKINRPIFRKSMSMNDADIMSALSRSSAEPQLIGDFSKPFCLPLMQGKHRDLKSISSDTLARLLRGEFDHLVDSYKIIDCRYPYEYEGGHIQGAYNFYTQEQILEELVNCKTEAPVVNTTIQSLSSYDNLPKRNILVFHCEFSSERGPKLSRFLRNHDRWRNSNLYPALHYPEIYLLHGGYKEFFENFSELCNPNSYRPMLEPSFCEEYKRCRAKSKSWSGDVRGSSSKYGLKKSRSRLLL